MTPSSSQLSALVDPLMQLLIEAADTLIVPRFRRLDPGEITTKSSPTDLVTIADTETEAWLTPRLASLLPGSRVVGEEATANDEKVLQALDGPAPVWVVDPVDGTRNFAQGKETFVTMLALVVDQQPILGMIWRPLAREALWAVKGQGAWRRRMDARRNPSPSATQQTEPNKAVKTALNVRRVPSDIGEQSGAISFKWLSPEHKRLAKSNAQRFGELGSLGCAGEEYARVAEGRLDFSVFGKLNAWDHCPGICILREAGGGDLVSGFGAYATSCTQGLLIAGSGKHHVEQIHRELLTE